MLLAWPALAAWIKANPRHVHWAYFGVGMLPFTMDAWNLDGALITWGGWPGYAKGIIFTLLDAVALAIIVTHRKPRGLPPLSRYVIAYILAALLSVAMADVPMASTFYVWQVIRMLILMTAVAKIASDERALTWVAMGLATGIGVQALYCIEQKLQGTFQAYGTLGHQNLLGLMAEFVLLPLLALMLGGVRNRVMMAGVIASLLVIGLGASRGAVAVSLGGAGLLILLSIMRRSTPRKWQVVGFAAFALALTSPIIIQGMHNRFGQLAQHGVAADGVDVERLAFERAAKAMWADHPMGVGANEYVVVANSKGYSGRAGVIWNGTSRAANVHNTYLLVAAETGWFGLVSFIALFAAAIYAGLRFAFQNKRDPRGDIVLGFTVALIATAVHNQYEWVWVTYQAQCTFAISLGVISGMMRARALEERERRRKTKAQPTIELAPVPDAIA
jgi:O-antigen ligase